MVNTRKTLQTKGSKRKVTGERYLSIKPCKVRIKRFIWHPNPLQNNDEIFKSPKCQKHVAEEILKEGQHCLDERQTALTTSKPTQLKRKRTRTVDRGNAAAGSTSTTAATGTRITKEKSVKNQKNGHSKQITKSKQKANTTKAKASKEASHELPNATITKYFFANKETNKPSEKRCNAAPLTNGSVYEFHSQSTICSNTKKSADPSADIIRKLIQQGKVRVATRYKGKGKPILKRVTSKKTTVQKRVRFDNRTEAQPTSANSSTKTMADNIQPDNLIKSNKEALSYAKAKASLLPLHHQFEKNSSFSPLAQLVLRKQANRFNQTEAATQTLPHTKSISTPIKKPTDPTINLTCALSPIQRSSPAAQNRISYTASPWRVNMETNLPSIFNFSLSSDCCPSFSSDFINSPPPRRIDPSDRNDLAASNATTPVSAGKNDSQIRPYSLNDSANLPGGTDESIENVENLAPQCDSQISSEALKSFSELNDSRNAQQRRLPLKPINILSVVELPPWKAVPTTNAEEAVANNEKEPTQPFMNPYTEVREDIPSQKENILRRQFPNSSLEYSFPGEFSRRKQFENDWDSCQPNYEEEMCSESEEDRFLFGFEEYFNYKTQQSSRERVDSIIANDINYKRRLHERRCDLKRLRPQLCPAPRIPPEKSNIKHRNIFDCNLRQMRIQQLFENQQNKKTDEKKTEDAIKEANFMEELFSNEHDFEPPNALDNKKVKRNYERGRQRRIRLIEKEYTICLDSDESADELNSDDDCVIKRWHTNAGKPLSPIRRGRQKVKKENPELINYITSFNAMCEDVEKFNLIVEEVK